jgi:hypothetical protein
MGGLKKFIKQLAVAFQPYFSSGDKILFLLPLLNVPG